MAALARFRRLAAALAMGLGLGATGCVQYGAPVQPPQGFVYTNFRAPLSVEYAGTKVGDATKKVSQSQTQFLWIPLSSVLTFAWDDAAVEQIAREGGLESVSFADYELFHILGIYARFTVNVYGN